MSESKSSTPSTPAPPAPPPVSGTLDAIGVPHRVFVHESPPRSLEEAAAGRGHRPEQVVRSLLFRVREDEYALVLVAGPAQVPWKPLRSALGRSRISMATPEEVLAVTGHPVGAVAPFGMPSRPRLLLDASVEREDEVSMGSGVRGTAILLASADLVAALEAASEVERVDLFNDAAPSTAATSS